jgi:type VI secretion system protein ImpJ
MLLCPQHMQQQDLYHEQNLAARVSAVTPMHWGVVTQSFDASAVKAGQVALMSFRGVLPDGTPIVFEATSRSDRRAGRSARASRPTCARSRCSSRCPTIREGVANYVSGDAAAAMQRYRIATRSVFDLTQARNERELQFSDPNLTLLFGNEPRDDYTAIKIAEIVRDEGGFRISDEFTPPCLALSAAPALHAGLQDLLGQVVTKRRKLAEERRSRDGVRIEFNAQDITRYLFLQVLNGAAPVLQALRRHAERSRCGRCTSSCRASPASS